MASSEGSEIEDAVLSASTPADLLHLLHRAPGLGASWSSPPPSPSGSLQGLLRCPPDTCNTGAHVYRKPGPGNIPQLSFPCSHSPPLEGCKFSRSRIISRPTPSHVSPATSLSVTPSRWPPRSPLLPAPVTASLCSLPEHGDSLWGQERLGMGLGPQAHIHECRDARIRMCTPCAVWVSGGSSCCMPGFGVLQSWKSGGSLVPLSRDLGFMWPCITLGSSKIPILWCLLSPPAARENILPSLSPCGNQPLQGSCCSVRLAVPI